MYLKIPTIISTNDSTPLPKINTSCFTSVYVPITNVLLLNQTRIIITSQYYLKSLKHVPLCPQVIFKYDFLGGSKAGKANSIKEMEPLQHIGASEDLQHLLKHPVLMSYLHLKWYNVRVFFYTNLIVFTAFVLLMTTYILLISNKYVVKDFAKDCLLNSSCNRAKKVNSTVREQYVRNTPSTVETTTVSDASEGPWITEEFVAVFCIRYTFLHLFKCNLFRIM